MEIYDRGGYRMGDIFSLPDIVQDFRRIYQKAAAEGREARLFGEETFEKACVALRCAAIKDAREAAGFYFEFPLSGKPCMDLLLQYTCGAIRSPVKFAEGNGFGLQNFFDNCASDEGLKGYGCGFSFDLSRVASVAKLGVPGIYLVPTPSLANADYVPLMLKRLGKEDCISQVMEAFANAPPGWRPYYAGCMAGRVGGPVRLGFFLPRESQAYYSAHPLRLAEEIELYGGRNLLSEEKDKFSYLIQNSGVWDLQFDLFPDGSFANALGVTLNMGVGDADPRNSEEFMMKGKAGQIMRCLESWGLADSRWHEMGRACYGVLRMVRENGRWRAVGDTVRLNTVKVRFREGRAYLAKGYLFAQSYCISKNMNNSSEPELK